MSIVKVGIIAAALFLLSGTQLFAKEMSMTLDDGRQVILHEDSTWGFTKVTVSEGDEEDIYATIGDGRTICLRTDKTWSFVKGQPPEKNHSKSCRLFR